MESLSPQDYYERAEHYEKLFEDEDTLKKERFLVSDEIAEKVYEIVEKLESEQGKPPTWMQVRQYFDKIDISKIEGMS